MIGSDAEVAARETHAHAEMRANDFVVWDRGGVPSVELPDDQGWLDLKPTDDGYSASITCRRPHGTIAWRALPPEGAKDAWTDVSVDGTTMTATSWSCWQVQFDVATGREIERVFTK